MNADDELLKHCRAYVSRPTGRGPRPTLDWESVVREWLDCRNQHAVARRLGLRPTRVGRILRRLGVRVGRGKRAPVHWLPMEEVGRRYEAGESCAEIGKDLGVDAEVIRRRMRAAGMPRRPLGKAKGSKNPQWKGGKSPTMHYYRRQAYEVAAICLGRPLPRGWIIHHVDENPRNNEPTNVMIFPTQSQHMRYHQRLLEHQRANPSTDAIRLALENGALPLPPPPAQFVLPPDTGPHVPSQKKRLPASARLRSAQGQFWPDPQPALPL